MVRACCDMQRTTLATLCVTYYFVCYLICVPLVAVPKSARALHFVSTLQSVGSSSAVQSWDQDDLIINRVCMCPQTARITSSCMQYSCAGWQALPLDNGSLWCRTSCKSLGHNSLPQAVTHNRAIWHAAVLYCSSI